MYNHNKRSTNQKYSLILTHSNFVSKKLSREERLMLTNDRNPAKIAYKKFEKIILDFQMKSHEKFLSSFLQCFK